MGKGLNRTGMQWAAALLLGLAISVAGAQEPVATSLDASEAENFIGDWTVTFDFQGNTVNMRLNVAEVDGKAGAILKSPVAPEPTVIDEIIKSDEGLTFQYKAEFGGNPLNMEIVAAREGEGLKGTIQEASGLFSAELTGKRAEAGEES